MTVEGPARLRVAGPTQVAVAVGSACDALIRDAWSQRLIGDVMNRRIDARLTLAALGAAMALRQPPAVAGTARTEARKTLPVRCGDRLCGAGLVGSMARRGYPDESTTIERLMNTPKSTGLYLLVFESAEPVALQRPAFQEPMP